MKNLEGFSVRMKCGPFLTLETWFFAVSVTPKTNCADKKVQKRLLFATEYMLIKPKGSTLLHFWHYATFSERKKFAFALFEP